MEQRRHRPRKAPLSFEILEGPLSGLKLQEKTFEKELSSTADIYGEGGTNKRERYKTMTIRTTIQQQQLFYIVNNYSSYTNERL